MMIFIINRREHSLMRNETEWQARVKGILKAELKRRGITYQGLADRMAAVGIKESPRNIANKISRGGFTAVFLIQCLDAIGCRTLVISGD